MIDQAAVGPGTVLLERDRRRAALQASRPSYCVRISAGDLNALLNQNPILWKHTALSLANVSMMAMTGVHDLM